MTPIFLNNWSAAADVFSAFDGTRWSSYREPDATPIEQKPEFVNAEILFASYGTDNYSGDAFVLFRRYGELFEVNGSHCSCYGLEGQWDPEVTTVEALRHRLDEGSLGVDSWSGNEFADELRPLLDELAATGSASHG